jgi:hypothetical protein
MTSRLVARRARGYALHQHGEICGLLSMTDAARMFEVLAGEDAGYIGGAPTRRFARTTSAPVSPTSET